MRIKGSSILDTTLMCGKESKHTGVVSSINSLSDSFRLNKYCYLYSNAFSCFDIFFDMDNIFQPSPFPITNTIFCVPKREQCAMFTIESLIKDDKVCTQHNHLMVIAFIELARADYTLHTLQSTQVALGNITPLHLLFTVQTCSICIFTSSDIYLHRYIGKYKSILCINLFTEFG